VAVLGIVLAAAITFGTSQLVRQHIGLASEPITAGRTLLAPVAAAAVHVTPRESPGPQRSTESEPSTPAPEPPIAAAPAAGSEAARPSISTQAPESTRSSGETSGTGGSSGTAGTGESSASATASTPTVTTPADHGESTQQSSPVRRQHADD
jgi:hypothetical protein